MSLDSGYRWIVSDNQVLAGKFMTKTAAYRTH